MDQMLITRADIFQGLQQLTNTQAGTAVASIDAEQGLGEILDDMQERFQGASAFSEVGT